MTRTLVALGLLSGAGVGLELALTRVMSALDSTAFVYLVLSTALLGLGLGAALAALYPPRPGRFSSLSAAAGFSTLLLALLVTRFAGLPAPLVLTLAIPPFLFIGLVTAGLFARNAHASPRLYWADLSGAGLGALAAPPLLNLLGGINALFAAALLLSFAGLLFTRRSRGALGVSALAAATLTVGVGGGLDLNLNTLSPAKPVRQALANGAELSLTRWDAFARTDVVRDPRLDTYALYLDGGAGSVIPDLKRPELWEGDIGSFPFRASSPESVFLLGSGGGLDVALAQRWGAAQIVAAELNAASLELVRALEPQVGTLYGSDITVLAEEGRRALRGAGQFDLISLSHVVTGTAEVRGHALSENTLYTKEAFRTYLGHLTPEGQLALKLYDEVTLTRALTTVIQVLGERGESERAALTHTLALLDSSGARPVPLLLVSPKPFSRDAAVRLGRLAEASGYGLLLLPHLLTPPALAGLQDGTATLGDVVAASETIDLRPTTDDRPFFFLFEPRLPQPLPTLLGVLTALLLGLVALSSRAFRGAPAGLGGVRGGMLFAALGGGFMLTEVFVLQRGQLVIAHPTLTLSRVLAVLLLSGGLGSYLLARRVRSPRGVAVSCALAATLLLLWGGLEPLIARTPTLLLSLAPVGFVLGIPFAAALRLLSPRQVALAWALSGVGSVFGSVLALALAARFGYHTVWWASLGMYGLAALVTALPQRVRATIPLPTQRQL